MKKDCVSIIIPVYNVSAYLERCMESVLHQTYRNLEIWLVDDGSTDQSGEMCDRYAQQDPRIQVIHKANGGLSSARNAALDVCEGEFIGFVDSDDYVDVQMIEKLMEAAHRSSADLVICNHFEEKENRLTIQEPVSDTQIEMDSHTALFQLIHDTKIRSYAWDKLYRRELFEGVRYPDGRNYEDIATTYLLFERAKKIVHIPDYLYYYQMREGSISAHKTNEKWLRNLEDIITGSIERYHHFAVREKELADLCLRDLVPYGYTLLKTAVSLNNTSAYEKTAKWLSEHKTEIMESSFVSEKDKKVFHLYTSGIEKLKLYQKTKKPIKKVTGLVKKSVKFGKSRILQQASNIFDFSLSEGKQKRILFFELPCFDNLGDHAIAYAQKQFLNDFIRKHEEYELFVIDGWKTVDALRDYRKYELLEDIVILQGGGNLGNLYEFANVFRKKIMQQLKEHKILLFPQTIYFEDNERRNRQIEEMQKYTNACKRLTMMARDAVSRDIMEKYFNVPIILINDIVSYLDQSNEENVDTEKEETRELSFENNTDAKSEFILQNVRTREGILICLRSDCEGSLYADEKKKIMEEAKKTSKQVLVTDTVTGGSLETKDREQALFEKWRVFRKHRLVITDRLHGMIFSLITATPCIVLANNHYKVTETYKTFQGCPYLYYANTVEEAVSMISSVWSQPLPTKKYSMDGKFDVIETLLLS